ncbi:MAG: SRPBCC family protein [Desulfobacterales bacterium]|jgi:uncharacterized protein YndB with AHSA1/START domain
MSTTLRHAIKINASREKVFKALTKIDEMASWHHGPVEGDIAVGSVMYLNPKPGLKFGWEIKELVNNERVAQKCVEGPGSSAGKTLTFNLSDAGAGSTLVELSDGEWADNDAHLPYCNTHWGSVLHRLKNYVE